jgi:hypothetical protein
MDVWVYSVFVLSCVGIGLATGSSSVQGVLMAVYKIHNSRINSKWEQARDPNPSLEEEKEICFKLFIYSGERKIMSCKE